MTDEIADLTDLSYPFVHFSLIAVFGRDNSPVSRHLWGHDPSVFLKTRPSQNGSLKDVSIIRDSQIKMV